MDKQTIFNRFRADESGATAIEYSLICAIMFLAVVAVSATGGSLETVYREVAKLIDPLGGNSPPPPDGPP